MVKWISLAFGLLAVAQTTQTVHIHPLRDRSEARLQRMVENKLIDTKRDAKQIRQVRAGVEKQDARISQYLSTHDLSDRIKQAVAESQPCPTMPEELLLLMGKYTDTHQETENGRRAEWGPFGYAFPRDSKELVVSNGVVRSVSPTDGRGMYSNLIPD